MRENRSSICCRVFKDILLNANSHLLFNLEEKTKTRLVYNERRLIFWFWFIIYSYIIRHAFNMAKCIIQTGEQWLLIFILHTKHNIFNHLLSILDYWFGNPESLLTTTTLALFTSILTPPQGCLYCSVSDTTLL